MVFKLAGKYFMSQCRCTYVCTHLNSVVYKSGFVRIISVFLSWMQQIYTGKLNKINDERTFRMTTVSSSSFFFLVYFHTVCWQYLLVPFAIMFVLLNQIEWLSQRCQKSWFNLRFLITGNLNYSLVCDRLEKSFLIFGIYFGKRPKMWISSSRSWLGAQSWWRKKIPTPRNSQNRDIFLCFSEIFFRKVFMLLPVLTNWWCIILLER